MGVRCFGLIFLGLCYHLWCYFVVKNGVLAAVAVAAAAAAVRVAVAGGCDCCLLYRIYYFIVIDILFYCDIYIILLC